MDLLDAGREIGFCFMWTIQNYNVCFRKNKDIFYDSPSFELDANSVEKWSFTICPKRYFRHDSIQLALQRCTEGKRRDFTIEVSIYDGRSSFIKTYQKIFPFNVCERKFISNLKLIVNKEILGTYPNNDSLTIKCIIWQLGEVLQTRRCYARTILDAERIRYPCALEGFEEIENGTQIKKRIIILSEIPVFTMDLCSTEETSAENKIEIKIKPIEPNNEFFSTCEISLIDADGNVAHSVRDEFYFETSTPEQVWTFPFMQVSKVLSNKNLYLPNGILLLNCEFVVSSGVKYNKVERTEYRIRNRHLLRYNDKTTDSDFPGALKDNLQRFYEERKFSDITIRTPSKEFPAHKTILCARSEVFSAMFEHDTKEKQTGVVEIKDVDDDTVSRMLLFLYTDTVGEDLEMATASSLYFAADKYEIVALKRKCADFLKGRISVTNVFDVLLLADVHQDVELKSFVQKFIFEHSEEIVNTAEWKEIMVNQPQLASETMHQMLKKLIIS